MYFNEYFFYGIINGVSWYNVLGKYYFILRLYNLIDFLFFWMVLFVIDFFNFEKELFF